MCRICLWKHARAAWCEATNPPTKVKAVVTESVGSRGISFFRSVTRDFEVGIEKVTVRAGRSSFIKRDTGTQSLCVVPIESEFSATRRVH